MEVLFESFIKQVCCECDVQSSVLEAEGKNKIHLSKLYQACRGFQMAGEKPLTLFKHLILKGTM